MRKLVIEVVKKWLFSLLKIIKKGISITTKYVEKNEHKFEKLMNKLDYKSKSDLQKKINCQIPDLFFREWNSGRKLVI